MSEVTQGQTLEQTLNKTDIGHVLYENRKVFLGAVIAVVVAVTGWVGYKEAKKSKGLEDSVQVFEFQSKVWKEAKEGKISPEELSQRFSGLSKEVQTAPVMIPVALEMGKFLYEKGKLAEADAVLGKLDGTITHPVGSFFIGMQRAVIQEKQGNLDAAVATLEGLSKNKDILMPAKVSIDLGRLYLLKGEKGKAQTQFDYVLSTYPNGDEAKLAKLYKAQLSQ